MPVLKCFVRSLLKVHARSTRYHRTSLHFHRTITIMQNEQSCHETLWDPMNFFRRPPEYKYAVVVLNRPIKINKNILLPLWEKAQVTITVDRGTDQWMTYLGDLANDVFSGKSNVYAPTMITGDMDSMSLEMRDKLENVGVRIIKTPDQNNTDYTKALKELAKYCKSQDLKLNDIYVLVDSSGRFDHIIGNINTLYKSLEFFEETQVIQVASNSLTWLMKPGKHRIFIPKSLISARSWCGLMPFGSRIHGISTSGLEWNLKNGTLEYGGMVSTSNTYNKECNDVTIDINDKVVWTMGIEPLLENFGVTS